MAWYLSLISSRSFLVYCCVILSFMSIWYLISSIYRRRSSYSYNNRLTISVTRISNFYPKSVCMVPTAFLNSSLLRKFVSSILPIFSRSRMNSFLTESSYCSIWSTFDSILSTISDKIPWFVSPFLSTLKNDCSLDTILASNWATLSSKTYCILIIRS